MIPYNQIGENQPNLFTNHFKLLPCKNRLQNLVKSEDVKIGDLQSKIADFWQGHKDLNPEPTVLETAALPIELFPYISYAF